MGNIYAQLAGSTPQSMPIPGREAQMAQNNAGGWGFKLDRWERYAGSVR